MGSSHSLFKTHYDVVIHGEQYMKDDDYIKETGWAGVKQMMLHDNYGNSSPQIKLVGEGTFVAALCSFLIGGAINSKDTYHSFIRNNEATAFENPHVARRTLYDKCFISFTKGAWKWGWRVSVFTCTFLFLNAAIPAYRGKYSIFDWTGSCALSGAVFKFKHGPKPMVAGSLLGAILGTMSGAFVIGSLKLTGLTMDDLYDAKKASAIRSYNKKHEKIMKYREDNSEI